MSFTVVEVDPHDIRESAIDFFWRLRRWPLPTIDAYRENWDWRYGQLGDGPPRIWIARDDASGEIIGHLAVHPRKYLLDGHELDAVVPGNFVVHRDHRNTLIGPRLAIQPRALVRRNEADMVLAFGNEAAHSMFIRQGFTDLGGFAEYLDVRRWAPSLHRRFRPAAALGPVLDVAFAVRRRLRSRSAATDTMLALREMNAAEVGQARFDHWAPSRRLEAAGSPQYLAGRFLGDLNSRRRMIGIFDITHGTLEGYAVVTSDPPIKLWDCRVNSARLDTVSAIQMVAGHLRPLDRLSVSTLQGSALAADLRARGLLERRPGDYDANRRWSVYLRPDHPLASRLGDPLDWALLYGSTHY